MQSGSINIPSERELADALERDDVLTLIAKLPLDRLQEVGAVLARIQAYETLDVLGFFDRLAWSAMDRRDQIRYSYVISGFITETSASPEKLVRFLHVVHSAARDANVYQLQGGFERWLDRKRSQSREILQIIQDGAWDSPFVGSVLQSWRQDAPSDALDATLDLCEDTRPGVRRQAIYALGSFVNSEDRVRKLAARRLASLMDGPDSEEKRVAVLSATNMVAKPDGMLPEVTEALEKVAEAPSAEIRKELILGLVRNRDAYPAALRSKVFELMKSVRKDDVETVNLIDMVLYNMDLENDPAAFADLLTTILGQSDGAPSLKSFDSAVQAIRSARHETLGRLVIRWLLEGEHEICSQIGDLFPPLDSSVYQFSFADFNLSDAEVFYLSRKVFGYMNFMHGPAVSLLYACLSALAEKMRKAMENEIVSFWLRNYPDDIEVFKVVFAAYPRDGIGKSIQRLGKGVEAYERALEMLPSNPALLPSARERRIQSEIRSQQNRGIVKAARKTSILGSIFHTKTILYGRSSVTHIYGGKDSEPVRQVVTFSSFEHSAALPRMSVLQPATFDRMLFDFRRERPPS